MEYIATLTLHGWMAFDKYCQYHRGYKHTPFLSPMRTSRLLKHDIQCAQSGGTFQSSYMLSGLASEKPRTCGSWLANRNTENGRCSSIVCPTRAVKSRPFAIQLL